MTNLLAQDRASALSLKPASTGARRLTVWARLRRFVFDPADPSPLAVFRIGASIVAIAQVVVLWPHLLQLYGQFGFVQWAIIETGEETWLPSIGKLSLLLRLLGVSSEACVYGVFAAYLACLVGLLLGRFTRWSAIAAWVLHALTVNSGYLSLYGVDTMIHIALFYCAWMPVGAAYSMDSRRREGSIVPSFGARLSTRVLQFHLCIIYANTGLAKAMGPQWWSGEAIWRALLQPPVFDLRLHLARHGTVVREVRLLVGDLD